FERVYTRAELLQGVSPTDAVGTAVLKSFRPERSGDLVVIPKPYHLLTTRLTGTGHGTPHPYDTHVPLLVYGSGVIPGVRGEAVMEVQFAAVEVVGEVDVLGARGEPVGDLRQGQVVRRHHPQRRPQQQGAENGLRADAAVVRVGAVQDLVQQEQHRQRPPRQL